MAALVDPRSVLFITLDSCRYDTFLSADAPHLKAVGPLHKAMAPGYFTFASHAAMFVGFTPGISNRIEPLINPKYGKIFKIVGGGSSGKGHEHFLLTGRSIIDGFNHIGYRTIGSGAVAWFNPETPTGRILSGDFTDFFCPGNTHSLSRQLKWLFAKLDEARGPVFLFLNVGETHVPYYFKGADWRRRDNPCRPFASGNNADECRRRQRLCVEFVDRCLGPLLGAFADTTALVCGDHGDCWGEDGLWEHGFYHEKVLEVPLLFRCPAHAARAAG